MRQRPELYSRRMCLTSEDCQFVPPHPPNAHLVVILSAGPFCAAKRNQAGSMHFKDKRRARLSPCRKAPSSALFFLQVEQAADDLDHGRGFGFAGGGFERA